MQKFLGLREGSAGVCCRSAKFSTAQTPNSGIMRQQQQQLLLQIPATHDSAICEISSMPASLRSSLYNCRLTRFSFTFNRRRGRPRIQNQCSAAVDGSLPPLEQQQNWQQSDSSSNNNNILEGSQIKWGSQAETGCSSPGPPQFALGAGILKEIHQKLPTYATDFGDGVHLKAAAAIIYMTFACLAPCFAFSGMIARLTECQIGLVETIVSCSVSGSLYSLLAAQPLTLLGPTGFMVVITGLLYKVTTQAIVPFLPVYGWVGIWTCFFLSCLAAVEASNVLVNYLTRFVDDTFTAFISIGFMSEAFKGIANLFKPTSPFPVETALLSFLLAVGTFTLAKLLTQLRATRLLLLQPVAGPVADLGAPLAIVTMSMVGPILFPTIPLPAIPAPSTIATTVGRPWLVPLFSLPGWAVAASAIPAVFVTLLIFLDQNMTTRLVNDSKVPLRKGAGYNLDLAAVGVIVGFTSLFGLPWMVASAVPSLNHVRSLVTVTKSMRISPDGEANKPEMCVLENRLTGLLISVCVGISLHFWSAVRLVPLPVTSGLFVFMALGIVNGNQFVERVKLWLYDQKLVSKHEFTKDVPQHILHAFTALQVACLWALWSLKQSAWGITFPILILALVPIRQLLAARIFPPQYLAVLDPHE